MKDLQAIYNDLLALQDQTDQVPLTTALDAVGAALRALDEAATPTDGYRDAWLEMIAHCNTVKADRFRLEQTIRDSIEALERNSTSAPVVECLKAALTGFGAAQPFTHVVAIERIAEVIREEVRTTDSGIIHNSTHVAKMILRTFGSDDAAQPSREAPIGGTESCTCHFFGAGTHHVPGCPFYTVATSFTSPQSETSK